MTFQLSMLLLIFDTFYPFSPATLERTLKDWTVGPSKEDSGVDLVCLSFQAFNSFPKRYRVI